MSVHWLEGDVVVTLMKEFDTGKITWNPHFIDPSSGEWANILKVEELGTKVIFTVRYAWRQIYLNTYNVYKVMIEKRTETGSWELIPSGSHQPDAAEFGNPNSGSVGQYDKTFEIIADEPKVPFRITAMIWTVPMLPRPSDPRPPREENWLETRQFQMIVKNCNCCR